MSAAFNSMHERRLTLVLALVLIVMPLSASGAVQSCGALADLSLPGVTLTSAKASPAGLFQLPALGPLPARKVSLPAFCRITGTAKPQVHFELWLPLSRWNGRLLAVGSGGFGGYIDYTSLAMRVAQGYAVTANDTGHEDSGLEWIHNRQALLAWGHDPTHRVADPSKQLIRAFYGSAPAHAYFEGCSTGGDQAMEEAEYFPSDFDGIVAESPGMDYSRLMLSFLWGLKVSSVSGVLSQTKLQLLHRFVIQACDAQDGLQDGILERPLTCHVDLAPLICKTGDGPTCLTQGEARTAALLYQGPHNPRTGAQIYPGFVAGSEADPAYSGKLSAAYGWSLIQGPLARQYAIPLLQSTVFGASWDWKSLDYDRDVTRVDRVLGGKIDAMSPDLRRFESRGGKLIMVQGWGDPYNAQTLPIEYRSEVIAIFRGENGRQTPEQQVDSFYRLFMAPGMGHCLWGPGPSRVHALAAVERWVERLEPPASLIAAEVTPPSITPGPHATRRPLCPYPQYARYVGGDPSVPRSFHCSASTAAAE